RIAGAGTARPAARAPGRGRARWIALTPAVVVRGGADVGDHRVNDATLGIIGWTGTDRRAVIPRRQHTPPSAPPIKAVGDGVPEVGAGPDRRYGVRLCRRIRQRNADRFDVSLDEWGHVSQRRQVTRQVKVFMRRDGPEHEPRSGSTCKSAEIP